MALPHKAGSSFQVSCFNGAGKWWDRVNDKRKRLAYWSHEGNVPHGLEQCLDKMEKALLG
jgi:hypothetical protein